ncbi:MAG: hypothetical protein GX348_07245 [Veillonellaceae bacterium]|jgi:YbbR domain-containing protein|nr:hypothetical protein [Veillonellaceae bacterium]
MDRFPKKNLTAKIIAVVFATILWLFVMNEQNPPLEVTYQAPLEVRNLASNMVISETPDYVRVRVRGPRSVVAGISTQDIKAYIDVRGVSEGINTVKVNMSTPSNIDIVEIMPDKISIQLDAVISRPVQVEIRPIGTPPTGLTVAKSSANVSSVRVEGPRTQLETVDKVIALVDVNNKSADFTAEVPLIAVNPQGKELKGVTLTPQKAAVTLHLAGINKKTVDVKTILVSEVPRNVVLRRIITEPDKIEISGDPTLIEKIESVFTEPINLANIDKPVEVQAQLQLREGIITKTTNVTVRIDIEKRP